MVGRPSRSSGNFWESFPEVGEWSGSPPGVLRVVRSGREALTEVQEWSGGSPRIPGVVGSGREVLPEVREWSGGPPGGPVMVGRPSRSSGNFRESFPEVGEWSGSPPSVLGVVRSGRETSRKSWSGREALS